MVGAERRENHTCKNVSIVMLLLWLDDVRTRGDTQADLMVGVFTRLVTLAASPSGSAAGG